MHDQKNSTLRSYNIIESWSEVICVSTLLLFNSTFIFGAFAGEQHLILLGDDKLTTAILFLTLLVRCSRTSSICKGGLRISLFPLIRSDIFSFVGFLVCFFLKTVALEAEWSSYEAVDGLSVTSYDTHTGKHCRNSNRPTTGIFSCAQNYSTVSKVHVSTLLLTVVISTPITALETLLFS